MIEYNRVPIQRWNDRFVVFMKVVGRGQCFWSFGTVSEAIDFIRRNQ